MARQVLPLIDLRTPAERQGITRTQQTMQAIAGILQTLGQTEQKRRERQKLDRITRAIANGATTIEAIAAASSQEPEFGGGISGGLQRIGGMFQPQTGGGIEQSIQQLVIGERLRQALMPKAEVPAGLDVAGVTVGPEGGQTTRYAPPETPTPEQPFTLGTGQLRFDAQGKQIAAGPVKTEVPKPTKIQELVKEGYSLEEARLIRDISHGLKPRASSAKHYENMSDVEKMKFLQTLLRSAEGPYYRTISGTEEPLSPEVAEWAKKELEKLPMLQTETPGMPEESEPFGPPVPAALREPRTQEEFLDTVKGIEDNTEAKAYYDKWVDLWQ